MGKSSSPDFNEGFEALLDWLDPDRERAGEKYEVIRQRLIKMFAWRKAEDPEGLADETIDRVVRRLPEIRDSYVGDPRLYFFGVGKHIFLEAQKRRQRHRSVEAEGIEFQAAAAEDNEQLYECLDRCITKLPSDRRDLLFAYYEGSKQGRIDTRRALAAKLNLSPAALRMTVSRSLNILEECIKECTKRKAEGNRSDFVE